ncbi:unnamed protein product [Lactuca virosa]|uniref:Uncharacterized protein n=1 Tax=Lactuca virosa TaxID=75947 RepID=A0AAU9P1P2_9ASTR|nr:unnamed protein product [Lactuca virosa]
MIFCFSGIKWRRQQVVARGMHLLPKPRRFSYKIILEDKHHKAPWIIEYSFTSFSLFIKHRIDKLCH